MQNRLSPHFVQTRSRWFLGAVLSGPAVVLAQPLPTTTVSLEVNAAGPPCTSGEGVQCPNPLTSASPGGLIQAYGGASAQATANLGTDPSLFVETFSSLKSSAFASANINYAFELQETAPGGPALPPAGVPIDIAANISWTSSVYTIDAPLQDQAPAEGLSVSGGPGPIQETNEFCGEGHSGQCVQGGDMNALLDQPYDVSLGASCETGNGNSCFMDVDPKITVNSAYAPYYSVVFNPDLTSHAPVGVPEPGTVALFGFGLGFLSLSAARQRSSRRSSRS
jgi:hypothetical protein